VCTEPLNGDNDNGGGDGFDDYGCGGLRDCCRDDCIGAHASNSFVNCCGDVNNYCGSHDF
jgi:hypothetical protein